MVSVQPYVWLHLRLTVVFCAASAHASSSRSLAGIAAVLTVPSTVEGRHIDVLRTRSHHSSRPKNKTAPAGKVTHLDKHAAYMHAPWWLKPVWGPLWARASGRPSDDNEDERTLVGDIEDEIEEEVEEVEEEVQQIETYEKRKWLQIFQSRNFYDWAVFAIFAMFFLWIYHRFLVGLPALTKYHGLAIVGWVWIGLLYNAFMYIKFGAEQATVWFNGYLLELIFSLENVFVFHVIIESFGTPTVCAQKALFIIVCCQVVFELVLYMGLADVIDCLGFLPYVLGAWLTYLGIHSALESDDHTEFDILETTTVRTLRNFLGDRLQLVYDDQGLIFSRVNGRYHMTMLGLVFFCLLGADFFLEIDVTLTKIEQSHDDYLSFTSSALAGFAVPELFFVARDLFRRFALLKFGISFVLVFYGTQMLFPGLIILTPLEGCGVIVIVMISCILLSIVFKSFEPEASSFIHKSDSAGNLCLQSDGDAAAGYGTTNPSQTLHTLRRNTYSFVFEKRPSQSLDDDEVSFESKAH